MRIFLIFIILLLGESSFANYIEASIIGYENTQKYKLYFVKKNDEFNFKVAYKW